MIGKIILYSLLILSWSSLLKLDKLSFKRYLPVGILTALIFTLLSGVNNKVKLWKVTTTIFPKLPPNFPFVFGPFIFLTIWIFKFTFGRFWLYLLTNTFADLLLAYPLTSFFEKFNIYKLKKITRFQVFLIAISSAIILYIYQLFINDTLNNRKESERNSKEIYMI